MKNYSLSQKSGFLPKIVRKCQAADLNGRQQTQLWYWDVKLQIWKFKYEKTKDFL